MTFRTQTALKLFLAIRTALFLALAALIPVFLSPLISGLRYLIGSLIIFYGADEMLIEYLRHRRVPIATLYWNLVEMIIGFTLLVLVKDEEAERTYTTVCVTWAVWSILRETRELIESTHSLKENISAIPNIVESLTAIGFSIAMLVEPTSHHATFHLYLLVAELATKVLFPHLNYLGKRLSRESEKSPSEEQTAENEAQAEKQSENPQPPSEEEPENKPE